MKSCFSIAVLAGACAVLAAPEKQVKEVVMVSDAQLRKDVKNDACTTGFTLTVTVPYSSPTPTEANFDFFGFCSAFIQPTATVVKTSTSIIKTSVVGTVTQTLTATVTNNAGGATTTVLCPVPSSTAPVCGSAAWGYAENNIYSGVADAASCHQLCLSNPACQSFQAQNASYASPSCNLYKVNAGGNNTIVGAAPFLFFDWDCPDYLPSQCTRGRGSGGQQTGGQTGQTGGSGGGNTSPVAPPPPASTQPAHTPPASTPPVSTPRTSSAAPTSTLPPYTLPSNPAAVAPGVFPSTTSTTKTIITAIYVTVTKTVNGKRSPATVLARAEAYATLPAFLSSFGSSSISAVCNCVITSPSPTVYGTTTTTVQGYSTIGNVVTALVTGPTVTVQGAGGLVTVISSVA